NATCVHAATQPARYCRPSSRSASDSIWGASDTSFSASAIASSSGCEYTHSKLERVLMIVNISTVSVHIWNGAVLSSRVRPRVRRPRVAAHRTGGPDPRFPRRPSGGAVRAVRPGPPVGAEQADLPWHRHVALRSRLPGARPRRQDLPAGSVADHAR